MPTFYFDIWDGNRIKADEHGIVMQETVEAFDWAVERARHMLPPGPNEGKGRSDWAFHVRNEQGLRLFTLPFSLAVVDPHYQHLGVRRGRPT